jgi:hypothetical protein
LIERDVAALLVHTELVPAHAAAARAVAIECVARTIRVAESAVDERDMILSPCESSRRSTPGCGTQFVSCPPQRYEYGATLIAVRSVDLRLRRILPVDVEMPDVHDAVRQQRIELPAAARDHDVRRTLGRQRLSINVRVVEEVHILDDDALLGRRFAREHRFAIGDARVLLRRDGRRDPVVARARRDVVAIGPDRQGRG